MPCVLWKERFGKGAIPAFFIGKIGEIKRISKKIEIFSKKVLTKGVGFGIIFEHLTKRPKRKGQGERP